MGLFENGLNIQRAKQANRIMGLAKKPAPNQIAIYRGKDPIDGTDIIQVGANEPVSGYRLISNNPISIGDRVYIRPSKQGFGLQRVDAPNVAKQTLPEVVEADRVVILGISLNPNVDSFLAGSPIDSFGSIGIANLISWKYPSLELRTPSAPGFLEKAPCYDDYENSKLQVTSNINNPYYEYFLDTGIEVSRFSWESFGFSVEIVGGILKPDGTIVQIPSEKLAKRISRFTIQISSFYAKGDDGFTLFKNVVYDSKDPSGEPLLPIDEIGERLLNVRVVRWKINASIAMG